MLVYHKYPYCALLHAILGIMINGHGEGIKAGDTPSTSVFYPKQQFNHFISTIVDFVLFYTMHLSLMLYNRFDTFLLMFTEKRAYSH